MNVNLSDMFGCNALMYATKDVESLDVVKLLLERKDLDLDEKDNDGKTAEDFALEIKNTRAVELIRQERLRRLGKVWTKEDCDDEESEQEERTSTPESEEIEQNKFDILSNDEVKFNFEDRQNDALKCQLTANIKERLEKEKFLLRNHEEKYQMNLQRITREKLQEEGMLKQKLQQVEDKYTRSKQDLEDEFLSIQSKSEALIGKLESLVDNVDVERLLGLSGSAEQR